MPAVARIRDCRVGKGVVLVPPWSRPGLRALRMLLALVMLGFSRPRFGFDRQPLGHRCVQQRWPEIQRTIITIHDMTPYLSEPRSGVAGLFLGMLNLAKWSPLACCLDRSSASRWRSGIAGWVDREGKDRTSKLLSVGLNFHPI
jgi:hypothetical protein